MTDAERDGSELTPPAMAEPGDIQEQRRKNLRVIGMAVFFLAAFALAMYAMQATRSGAVIVVEADEVATVYMKTGGIISRLFLGSHDRGPADHEANRASPGN